MKLKKILLPVFIGATLLMASFISVLSGIAGGEKNNREGRAVVGAELNLHQETPALSTTAVDEAFEITTYDQLVYDGTEKTLMTITPLSERSVYYKVVKAEYSSEDIITESTYIYCSNGEAGATVTITAITAGTYTVYYYLPAVDGAYTEVSSSSTIQIKEPKQNNLFEISIYDKQTYDGTAKTLMTIKPLTNKVYYDVKVGEYNSDYVINSDNYDTYSCGELGETVTISETDVGTYTVYYYIPGDDNYIEVASSATITIELLALFDVTLNPNGGTWSDGSTANQVISQAINSSYAFETPTKEGYHVSSWSGGHTAIQPVALKDRVMTFDGSSNYIALGRKYMYTDKLFVSVEAYMDDWTDTESTRLISCTEGGGWTLIKNGQYLSFQVRDSGANGYKSATYTITSTNLASGWHSLVGSFDGSYARLYIDGKLAASSSRFTSSTISYHASNGIFVGAEAGTSVNAPASDGYYFNGKMRNVYIANACVTSTEITSPRPTDTTGYSSIHILTSLEDTVMTAQWTANTYTVKFDGMGASGSASDITMSYGEEKNIPDTSFEMEGYVLAGWTTTNYTLGTDNPTIDYAVNAPIRNLTNVNGGVVTLYAVWKGNRYTAEVYVQDTKGIYTSSAVSIYMEALAGTTVNVAEEAEKILTSGKITTLGDGSEFVYDTLKADEEEIGTEVTIGENNSTTITFYFKLLSYTLTLDANGGTWADGAPNKTINQYHNSSYAIDEIPTKEGYHISSWSGGHTLIEPVALKNEIMTFDGDDYISLGRDYMYSRQLFVSVEAYMDSWANTDSMRLISSTQSGGWTLIKNAKSVGFQLRDGGAGAYKTVSVNTSTWGAGWHSIVGSFDGSYARIYVDGELIATSAKFSGLVSYHASNSILIGAEPAGGDVPASGGEYYFTGKMRNIYIANTYVDTDVISSPQPTEDKGYPLIHILSVSEDTIVTANWEANTYTVKFDGKGATGSAGDITMLYGEEKNIPETSFEMEEYSLAGWTTTDYTLGTDMPVVEYAKNAVISNLTTVNGGEVTLYAVWYGSKYTANVYIEETSGSYPLSPVSTYMEAQGGATVNVQEEAEKLLASNKLEALGDGSGFEYDSAKASELGLASEVTITGNDTTITFYIKHINI